MRTPEQYAERLERYYSRAIEAHAAGFASEAKRKDALADVNTAWEALRDSGFHFLPSDHWSDFPSYPHLWSAKVALNYRRWPDFAARAASLRALRDGIKGAELRPKVKVKTAAQVAKEAAQMTCQVCGRGIFAEAGVIAHHGYTRPWEGVQTASCPGARELPWEVASNKLADHLRAMRDHEARTIEYIADIKAERVALHMTWETPERNRFRDYVKRTAPVTRDAWAEVVALRQSTERYRTSLPLDFDAYKARQVLGAERQLAEVVRYIAEQTERLAAWKQTHRAGGAGEKTWVAL
jgi:hypothetical protein